MTYVDMRTNICRACSICDQKKEVCNANLYVNPQTNESSTVKKEGFFKGCGCKLKAKINNRNSRCPAGKWGEVL